MANNWSVGQGGDFQQQYVDSQQLNPAAGNMIRLPDGRLGKIADLVKYYSGQQGGQSSFHPTDLQQMVRDREVYRG